MTTKARRSRRFARARPDNLDAPDRHLRYRSGGPESRGLAPRLQAAGIAIRACPAGQRRSDRSVPRRATHSRRRRSRPRRHLRQRRPRRDELRSITRAGAPIDGFGIGTSLTTSSDVPALDCAYKLQEYAGCPGASAPPERRPGRAASRSGGTLRGRPMAGDRCPWKMTSKPASLDPAGHAGGRRLGSSRYGRHPRAAARDIARLPDLCANSSPCPYPVQVTDALSGLAAEVDRRTAKREA